MKELSTGARVRVKYRKSTDYNSQALSDKEKRLLVEQGIERQIKIFEDYNSIKRLEERS